jgi:type 1 fimbria pilin
MKKTVLLLPLGVALVISGAAHGHSSNLTVHGVSLPPPCNLSLGDNGIADYGEIPAASLIRGEYTDLPYKSVALHIRCPRKTRVGLIVADNRADSLIAALGEARYNFGLGKAGNANIGGYLLFLEQSGVTTDDRPANQIFSILGSRNWSHTGPGGQLGKDRLFSWAAPGTSVPAMFQTISGAILIIPKLNKPENLPLMQQIHLNGSVTLEIRYL